MVLVSSFPLHEDSGSTAHDVRGSNDGTVNGATQGVQGVNGNTAYGFSDGDSVTRSDTPFSSNSPSVIMQTAWVYPTSTGRRNITGHGFEGWDWTWDDDTSQGFSFRMWGDSTGSIGPTGLSLNSWHFVAIYWDVGNEVGLSVNGSQYYTYSTSNGLDDLNGEFRIGEYSQGGQNYWNGSICEVRIYDHALTSAEVQYLYEVGRGGQYVSDEVTI